MIVNNNMYETVIITSSTKKREKILTELKTEYTIKINKFKIINNPGISKAKSMVNKFKVIILK